MKRFLFILGIGAVIVFAVLQFVQTPLNALLFDASGAVKWPQLVALILLEIVFLGILLGDSESERALAAKTLVFVGLVFLLVNTGHMDWLNSFAEPTVNTAQIAQTVSLVSQPGEASGFSALLSFLDVPLLMLILFALWFIRTALWPALSR